MSKRTSRRLAVVAGAALAVGSMAPAMAARVVDVQGSATGNVSVDPSLDLGDLSGSALPLGVDGLLSTATDLTTLVQGQVEGIATAVQNDVTGIAFSLLDLPGVLLGGPSLGLASVGAHANVLGVVDALGAVGVGVPTGALGLVTGAPAAVLGTVTNLETLAAVQGTVGAVTEIATSTVAGASIGGIQETVLGLVPGGLLNGGLEDILGLSGGASLNVLASLLGTF